jgi:hypothetical protein
MNAAQTYTARLTEVRELIRRLDGQLQIHERRQGAEPRHWGYPGDLEYIAGRLRDIRPNHSDRRCEWKHPETCGAPAVFCVPDGRLLCHDHAPESGADPRECLDVATGLPADED